MLTRLTIRNFAIIDQVNAEFGPGMNALTGETGAGKSILVDALNLLLGSRSSAEMIRTGEEEAAVEACFDVGDRGIPLLENLGADKAEPLLVRRLIARSGRSRAFINGSAVPLKLLQDVGEELLNIYGQHEHQDFLDPSRHIDILDGSGGLLPLRKTYQEKYFAWSRAVAELNEASARKKERAQRADFLAFQSEEIARARVKRGEDEELAGERSRLAHAEKLYAIADFGAEVLYGESGSAVERLKSALQRLKEGAKLDPALSGPAESAASALFQTEDVASSLRAYRDRVLFDPKRLEAVEGRLDELARLKKKYGPSLDDVLAHREKCEKERAELTGLEERMSQMEDVASQLFGEAAASAAELSRRRKEVGRDLSAKLETELSTLGMKKARFQVGIEDVKGGGTEARLQEKGTDEVEFLFSPNPGEELKPLARIASGGELSRIMLALKRVFAEETVVKTLIFDEVDSGIGGGTAEIVGRKLKEISRKHQIFCITHLAQIASLADVHYRVTKKESGGRTHVEVKKLSDRDRTEEIARMLGGVKITEKTLEHAREMLG
ncbi:MAG TPA: DNA repair protein RecN, partial [Thermodesulfobacteriota bacterium]|nr:DNA repair protein RecN [Thermodesulfobacteriota bacterium]